MYHQYEILRKSLAKSELFYAERKAIERTVDEDNSYFSQSAFPSTPKKTAFPGGNRTSNNAQFLSILTNSMEQILFNDNIFQQSLK
jgi:hypothetical protein